MSHLHAILIGMTTAASTNGSAVAMDARKQIITALALVKRAHADLGTVRETCEDQRVRRACADAADFVDYVQMKLTQAESHLRAHQFEASAEAGIGGALQDMGPLVENLRVASGIVREEAMRERFTPITWLAEADGALSEDLVTAVHAAKTLAERVPLTKRRDEAA